MCVCALYSNSIISAAMQRVYNYNNNNKFFIINQPIIIIKLDYAVCTCKYIENIIIYI